MRSLHISTPTQVLHEETRNTRAAEERTHTHTLEVFVWRQTQAILKSLADDKQVNAVHASSWRTEAGDSFWGHPDLSG